MRVSNSRQPGGQERPRGGCRLARDSTGDRRPTCAAVMRNKLSAATLRAIACAMILATSVLVTNASGRRLGVDRIATGCPNLSVYTGKVAGRLDLRFQLKGAVSCQEAHRLIAEFFKRAIAGQCEGTVCLVQLPKGWSCSYFFATESKETGGALAGCAQATTGAKIRVYRAGTATAPVPKHRVEAAEFFVRYPHDRDVTCAIYDGRSGAYARPSGPTTNRRPRSNHRGPWTPAPPTTRPSPTSATSATPERAPPPSVRASRSPLGASAAAS